MAAETPLILVVEIEPANTVYFAVGASVRLHLNIVDADQGLQTNPDVLTLTVSPQFGSPTTYTYGVGTEIVLNSLGNFQADIPVALAVKYRLQFQASLNSINCGTNTTEVYGVNSGWW